MKIISEITGKTYPSVDECLKAEAQFKAEQQRKEAEQLLAKQKAEAERVAKEKARGERAKEVEKAYQNALKVREDCQKKINEADANYQKLLGAFLKDYKQFHFTVQSTTNNPIPSLLFDFFNI